GPTGTPVDQIRAGDQPQHRTRARPHRAADAARACRRGDRVVALSCCDCSQPLMAQLGRREMSAFAPLLTDKRTSSATSSASVLFGCDLDERAATTRPPPTSRATGTADHVKGARNRRANTSRVIFPMKL